MYTCVVSSFNIQSLSSMNIGQATRARLSLAQKHSYRKATFKGFPASYMGGCITSLATGMPLIKEHMEVITSQKNYDAQSILHAYTW